MKILGHRLAIYIFQNSSSTHNNTPLKIFKLKSNPHQPHNYRLKVKGDETE